MDPEQAPASGKKPRFFYGWVIVAISSLADFISFGAGNITLAVFFGPMTQALGWTRTQLTGATTFSAFSNVIVSPIIGPLIDRYDPRYVMVTGALIAGIAYMLMGGIDEIWQFYVLYAAALALGLHELGGLVTNSIVSKWFIRQRGRALGLSSAGNNIGAAIIVPAIAYIVGTAGWRMAWRVLGGFMIVLLLPPILLFMRRTPEDMGLRPDGDTDESEKKAAAQPNARPRAEEPRWTLREALRVPTTWMLVASFNLWSTVASSMLLHQTPYFTDIGLTLQAAALVTGLNHFAAFGAKITWGFLAERFPVRYCLAGCGLMRLTSILTLLLSSSVNRVYFYAVISGLGQGFSVLSGLIWADYYGRASVGTIRGVLSPLNVIASMGGPLFAAFVFDRTGSYEGAFWIFTGCLVLFSAGMLFAKPPGPAPSTRVAEPRPQPSPAIA